MSAKSNPPLQADQAEYQRVLAANVQVHNRLAKDYNLVEPHFRPENVARVDERLRAVCAQAGSVRRLLDLGCGTGFIINIAKGFVQEIDGIDATPSMLAAVDRDGPARIRLFEGDSGCYPLEANRYDVATAYSFLHHLYDIRPTLIAAHRALRPGGMLYADLDPNYYFWERIKSLNPNGGYGPVIRREVAAVTAKDEEIHRQFGVDPETFNRAEYQKAILGGFKEEDLHRTLSACGFTDIALRYYWFIGEGRLLNDSGEDPEWRRRQARIVENTLIQALPVSRLMFKYLGFTARVAK